MPGSREHTLTAPLHDPLMAVLIEANGVTETHYFTEAMRADALPVGEDVSSPVKLAADRRHSLTYGRTPDQHRTSRRVFTRSTLGNGSP